MSKSSMPTIAVVAAFAMFGGCAHADKVAPPPASALAAVEVDSSGVPFAPAPEGLLRPGAVAAIQGRLHATGFIFSDERSGRLDASTRESLRRFQASQDLPATGLPSYRTVEALQLSNDDIFFSARRPPPTAPARKSEDEGSVGTGPDPRPPAVAAKDSSVKRNGQQRSGAPPAR